MSRPDMVLELERKGSLGPGQAPVPGHGLGPGKRADLFEESAWNLGGSGGPSKVVEEVIDGTVRKGIHKVLGSTVSDQDDAIGDGEVSEHGSQASTCASAVSGRDAYLDLSVSVPPGSKWPSCFLCTTVANSPSPLAGAKPDDKYSGMIPWNSYSKFMTEDGTLQKRPKGSVCLPCRNNYKAIGYEATYGSTNSFAQYKKTIAKAGGAEVHTHFLALRKSWIQLHNDGNRKIKDKSKLQAARRQLKVETIKMPASRGQKPTLLRKQHGTRRSMGHGTQSKL